MDGIPTVVPTNSIERKNEDKLDSENHAPRQSDVIRSYGLGNSFLLRSFRDNRGQIIEPAQSLLISPALMVSDFKKWVAEAWRVSESEVKKPSLTTGGRVWMGVVHRLNQMIIIRKYKIEVEDYWMVTYVGTINENPPETKRRRIEYISQNAKHDVNASVYEPIELPNKIHKKTYNYSAPQVAVIDNDIPIGENSVCQPPKADDATNNDALMEPMDFDGVSMLLNLSAAAAGPVDREVVESVAALRQPPTSRHNTILESLVANGSIIQPENGMLLSAQMKVSDFKLWFAETNGVMTSEVRKAPASTGGRVWMATIQCMNRLIIVRKYRIDPEEYWMVTYYGVITSRPTEVKRSRIEHFRQVGGGQLDSTPLDAVAMSMIEDTLKQENETVQKHGIEKENQNEVRITPLINFGSLVS